MIAYTLKELSSSLSKIGICKGDTILAHSAIFSLGKLASASIADIPAKITETILEVLGSEGTLVVPAFNFAFCKGEAFDRQNTDCRGMGVFSEYVRTHPRSTRSFHPLQSLAAMGKFAEDICSKDTPSTFDKNGPIGSMIDRQSKLLLLGAPMQSASLVHYLEESFQVPYRYWKEFRGTYINHGQTSDRTYKMYARDLTLNPRLHLALIEDWLQQAGLIQSAKVGAGVIKACSFRSFLEVTTAKLKEDPYCLIKRDTLN